MQGIYIPILFLLLIYFCWYCRWHLSSYMRDLLLSIKLCYIMWRAARVVLTVLIAEYLIESTSHSLLSMTDYLYCETKLYLYIGRFSLPFHNHSFRSGNAPWCLVVCNTLLFNSMRRSKLSDVTCNCMKQCIYICICILWKLTYIFKDILLYYKVIAKYSLLRCQNYLFLLTVIKTLLQYFFIVDLSRNLQKRGSLLVTLCLRELDFVMCH